MDNWLKGLIAAACVAVIAGVSFYFWSAYQESKRQALLAEYRECQDALANSLKREADVKKCIFKGMISDAQIDARIDELRSIKP